MPNDPSSQPTQPLTDEDVRAINGRRRGAVQSLNGCDCMQPDSHGIVLDSLGDVPRLLAEVDRLRAELAEMETDRDKYQNWYDAAVDDLREAHLARNEDAALGLDQDGREQ